MANATLVEKYPEGGNHEKRRSFPLTWSKALIESAIVRKKIL
jgi:hypothetical protein